MAIREGCKWTMKPPLGTLPDVSHPRRQGLVLDIPMLESGGNSVQDYSGRSNSGKGAGFIWKAGDDGETLTFGGGGSSLPLTTGSGVATGRVSVAARITPKVLSRGDVVTCWNNGGMAGDQFDLLYGLTSGKPQFYISSGSAAATSGVGSAAMAIGNPYLVAGTYDGATVSVYLYGRDVQSGLQASAASSLTLGAGTPKVTLGNNAVGDGGFQGLMNRAMVWNRVLTPAEILSLATDPWADWTPPNTRRWVTVAGGGTFQPAWAIGSNRILGGGIY